MSANLPAVPPYAVSVWTAQEEAAGRAAWEAFCESVRPWAPTNLAMYARWEVQSQQIKRAWIAAAKAARAS